MNINELFEELQNNILEELNGELILDGNCIVWSHDIDREEIIDDIELNEDDDELEYGFIGIDSPEELLLQGYRDDLDVIERHIAKLDDYADWSFSDPEVTDTNISFKIF